NLMKEFGQNTQHDPEVMIALSRLAPDGKAIAKRWLETSIGDATPGWIPYELESRARVIGAMSRTSFESDCFTQDHLVHIHEMIAGLYPIGDEEVAVLEEWFERLGRLRTAGRLAVPRLNEWRKHPNCWIRLWASEALEQIAPLARPTDA